MRTSIARLIAVFGLLIGALAFGTAVSADGATVTNQNFCHTFSYGTICIDSHEEVNKTVTPSGNISYEDNQHGTFTGTFSGFTNSQTFNDHIHVLVQDGTVQVYNINNRATYTFNGNTVCITNRFHYANGQVQFYDFDVTPGAC